MAFNLFAGIVFQSGTDANLAGLGAIAGVTTFTAGNVTTYTMPHRLTIQGNLTIDHNSEVLVTSSNGINTIDINTGGVLNLGVAEVSAFGSGGNVFGRGTSLIIGKNGPGCCSNGPFTVRSGGTLNLNKSTIILNGVIVLEDGCFFNCIDGCFYSHNDDGNSRIRCQEGTGVNVNGLTTYGIQFDYLTDEAFTFFEGLRPNNKGIPVENAFGAIGAIRTWRSIPDYRNSASAFCNNWTGEKDVRIYQSEIGSELMIVPDNTNGHGGRIFHEWDITVTNSLNAPLENVKTYISDTNNGNRTSTNTAGLIDETGDRIYQATTGVTGKLGTQEVMTAMWYRTNIVGDLVNPDGNEQVDVRGKTGVLGEDLFDIFLASYLHNFATIPNVAFKGLKALDLNWTMFDDTTITETVEATVLAYTEIENAQKFYDRAKKYLLDNFAAQTETLVNRMENDIDGKTFNITIDATAAQPFAFDGTTITIRANTYTGNLRTTGNVTLLNGATLDGGIIDATGDSYYSFKDIDSWEVYSDAAKTTLLDSGTGIFRFVFVASTTYYLTVFSGGVTFNLENTPAMAGETEISLNVPALILSLQGKMEEDHNQIKAYAKKAGDNAEEANSKLI